MTQIQNTTKTFRCPKEFADQIRVLHARLWQRSVAAMRTKRPRYDLPQMANLGGKCKFAANAQRLCQFANSGHPSVGNYIRDAAAPHDGTEPVFPNAAPCTNGS